MSKSFSHSLSPEFPIADQLVPKGSYRYSQLRRFEQCPMSYYWEWIKKIAATWEGIESFMGTCVHSAQQELYEQLQKGVTLGLHQVDAFYQAAWKEKYSPETIRVCNLNALTGEPAHPPEFYFQTGRDCIWGYYLAQYPFEGEEIIWIEQEISFQLNGYTINGHPDLLTRSGELLRVRDYKCSNNQPSRMELEQSLQLPIYEIAFREHLNHDGPVELVWHFLRLNKEFTVTRSEQNLEQAKEKILRIIGDIEEAEEMQHYPYRVSFTCAWCAYNEFCPAYQERLEQQAA